MRGALAVLALGLTACTVLDSVDGYAGDPVVGGASGGGAHAGGGGAGWPSSCSVDAECADQDPCTDDRCEGTSCAHSIAAGASCSDADACNGDESCDASGACIAGAPLQVDDGNACTTDTCDPQTGQVNHAPKTYPPAFICAGGTFKPCPEGYYGRRLSCEPGCNTAVCSAFCVNSMLCEPACLAQVTACCGASIDNCPLACPAGYAPGTGFTSPECACTNCTGCSVPAGPAVICTRT